MVEIQPKKGTPREPRKPRLKPYQKVNAYTLKPSKQQILTLFIFIGLLAVHEVFVTPQVPKLNEAILWTMFGFRYTLIIILAFDYFKLSTKDPVDRLIFDESRRYKFTPGQLRECSLCVSVVKKMSHHCMTCDRCTQDFDHHCKYLNNCIGVRNYQYFIRLLIVFTIYSLLGIGISIWVLIENQTHTFLSITRKWIIVGYVCFQGLIACIVASLLGFHMYISCCANISTLEYITGPEKNYQKPQLKYVVIEPTPLSAQHLRKTYQFRDQDKKNNPGIRFIPKDHLKNNQVMQFYRK